MAPERWELVAMATSGGVLLVYLLHAVVLIFYPWDWSPDEGLFLDYARRMFQAPASLYPQGTSVPFPLAWTPLLPALLAPIVAWLPQPLAAARLLALGWTVGIALGVYVLVGRRGTPGLAMAAAALAVAPMGLTFWYMIVRMDGLMIALWIWAAVILLPLHLRRGGGSLGWGRAFGGAVLIVAAFLAKQSAVVHCIPLVLVWLAVDLRSAARAAVTTAAVGGAAVWALQHATSGGFLGVQALWKDHPWELSWIGTLLLLFAREAALLLSVALVALALAVRVRHGAWRDATLALWAGAAMIAPALAKYGSSSNYLVPVVAATAVLTGRWLGAWSEAAPSGDGRRRRLAASALACSLVAACAVAATRFPLPTGRDRAAAGAFYRAVEARGGPILALRPDYAYFRLGQPVEAEGSSFVVMLLSGVEGIEVVPRRIAARYYRTIVLPQRHWYVELITDYVHRYYRDAAYVELGTCVGPIGWRLLVPREDVDAAPIAPR